MYTISRTGDFDGVMADVTTWNALADGVPFRESSWLAPWWKHFGGEYDAYLLLAHDELGTLCGILPLYRREDSASGRVLGFMGDGQACSDFASLLASDREAVLIARAMGQFLVATAGDARHGWEVMNLDGISAGDPAINAMLWQMTIGGAAVHLHSRMSSWYRPCATSWEAHLASHGKSQRRKLRHWSEQLMSREGLERHVVQHPDELPASLDALIHMHQRRWTTVGEPGSFADPHFEAFIRDSAADFMARGRVHLTTLSYQTRKIAAELHWVGGNHRLYFYSSGFDTAAAAMEPGRLLHVDTLRHLYREGLAGIDYLRGDEPYKQRMGAVPTKVLCARVAAPSLITQMLHTAWLTRFEFKQWLRRQAGRTPIDVLELTCS